MCLGGWHGRRAAPEAFGGSGGRPASNGQEFGRTFFFTSPSSVAATAYVPRSLNMVELRWSRLTALGPDMVATVRVVTRWPRNPLEALPWPCLKAQKRAGIKSPHADADDKASQPLQNICTGSSHMLIVTPPVSVPAPSMLPMHA